MPGQLLPGRPGNLTIEQQVKLQEFWKVTLKVFGVAATDQDELKEGVDGLAVDDEDEGEEEVDSKADGKGSEKEKKKRKRNIFGRKKKDKDSKDNKAEKQPAEDMPTGGADDKYGQTKEFHEALASNAPEDIRKAFWEMVKADHPDGILLRYLRARKWDIEKALIMMISTLHWRLNTVHVDDDIMLNGDGQALEDTKSSDAATKKAGEDFLAQLKLGKSFLHGTDKEGRPMCFVRVRLHKQGEQAEQSLERYTVYTIETARFLLSPPVDTAVIIFDMTSFSLANMDYAPVKFMIKCFEANYPESLGVVLVHKAPWVFQGIWKIIKGWLDPVVAGKIHFTSSASELETYVDRDHIISELEGDEAWKYSYIEPQPDENAKMRDTETRDKLRGERAELSADYEAVTRVWISGKAKQPELMEKRDEIAAKLKKNYWDIDPYIRARSYYDRVGLIAPGGVLSFYEGETKPAAGVPLASESESERAKEQATAASAVEAKEDVAPEREGRTEAEEKSPDMASNAEASGASGAILEPGLTRTRSRTPSRAPSSRNGPVPAQHDDDGVD